MTVVIEWWCLIILNLWHFYFDYFYFYGSGQWLSEADDDVKVDKSGPGTRLQNFLFSQTEKKNYIYI